MDTKLKKYRTTTEHPKWNFNGHRVDLREISDREAAQLVKKGFGLIEKIPSSKGDIGSNNKDRGESRS